MPLHFNCGSNLRIIRQLTRSMIYLAILLLNAQSILAKPASCIKSHSKFSSVVVFGDSYSDNGHNVSEPLKNPVYEALGNASIGIQWPNTLVKKLSVGTPVKLYDYAYNGAHANQNLTKFGVTVPDTREQIETYLSDLSASNVTHGSKEVLYIMWIGINSIDAIWTDAVDPDSNHGKGALNANDPLFVNATTRVKRQLEEIKYQLKHLREDHNVKKFPSKYMIITVPDVSITPLQRDAVKLWTKGNKQQEKDLLKLLRTLIKQYNDGLKSIFAKPQSQGTAGHNLKVYDVSHIWNFIVAHPQKYGIKNITDSCFTNNTVCSRVDEYFFWDYIHTTPKVEKILGQDIYDFVSCQF